MSEQDNVAKHFLEKAAWYGKNAERFETGDHRDPRLAFDALQVWRDHPRQAHECDIDAGVMLPGLPVMYGPLELDQYNVARAKTVREREQRYYRSAMRLLTTFADRHGIDAAPLSKGENEVLVLRVEAAIQAELRPPPAEAAVPPEPPAGAKALDGANGSPMPAANVPTVPPEPDWQALLLSPPLSAAAIAEALGQPVKLVERTLRYFREQHDSGFVTDEDAGTG